MPPFNNFLKRNKNFVFCESYGLYLHCHMSFLRDALIHIRSKSNTENVKEVDNLLYNILTWISKQHRLPTWSLICMMPSRRSWNIICS